MIRKLCLILICFIFISSTYASKIKWKSKRMWVIVTAYCPKKCCCGEHANGKTAINRDAYTPGVAVDPKTIPLGSRVDIPNYPRQDGIWILADDVGGKIKGNRIDVRFDTHEEALKFGIQKLRIRVWTR